MSLEERLANRLYEFCADQGMPGGMAWRIATVAANEIERDLLFFVAKKNDPDAIERRVKELLG